MDLTLRRPTSTPADANPTYAIYIRPDGETSCGAGTPLNPDTCPTRTIVGTLTNPAVAALPGQLGTVQITAPGAGIDLAANTRYWIVIESTTSSTWWRIGTIKTATQTSDASVPAGWNIYRNSYSSPPAFLGQWATESATEPDPFKMDLYGYEKALPPPPPPPVITSAEGVTYSGDRNEGFSLTPHGEGGSIVYRRRTIDLPVTRDECPLPDNPALIISRSTLDRVREITFVLSETPPQDPPSGFHMEGCAADIDPGITLRTGETVTVCLPPTEVQGKSHIYRYDDGSGEWERLSSQMEKEVNGENVVCGETDTFSLFGVFLPVIESAEGVLHSEDAEDGFSLTPLGVGGSIVYGERTIGLSVTGDIPSSGDPAVIVPRDILDRVNEITFELSQTSPQDPPPGLRLEGFAAETYLGVALGMGETVTVCLPSSGGEPDLYRYNDELGEWELFPSRVETVNGDDVVCADAGASSLMGVFVEETGGCAVAAASGEGTIRWQGALFNLLLAISALLLIAKLGGYDRKAVSG